MGLISKTGPDPLENHKHSMLDQHRPASETQFNGVLLAGRWWPAYSGIWILHFIKKEEKKTLSELGPPLSKLSESAHASENIFATIF